MPSQQLMLRARNCLEAADCCKRVTADALFFKIAQRSGGDVAMEAEAGGIVAPRRRPSSSPEALLS